MKPFGLSRFHYRPGVASSALTSSTRALVSDPTALAGSGRTRTMPWKAWKKWPRRSTRPTGNGGASFPSGRSGSFRSGFQESLNFIRERTDLLFYDPATELGCAFFGGQVRWLPMRQAFKVAMTPMWSSMRPSRGRNFCKTPEDFRDLFARIFSKGSK